MRPAGSFLLAWAVLQTQFSPQKSLQFQFVNIGKKVQIQFVPVVKLGDGGVSFSWYKRGVDGGMPVFIESCQADKPAGRSVCKPGEKRVTLEISRAQREDSGLYLCARSGEDFHLASALVVGDSYAPSTQVTILRPAARDPSSQKTRSGRLACVVQGVSNLVEVSWKVSGGLRQRGETFLVKNLSGSLTFVSLLPVPTDVQSGEGKVTCGVRFNSSGASERKSTIFAPHNEDKCLPFATARAGVGGLAFLLLLLSFLWNRFCPSKPRNAEQGKQAEDDIQESPMLNQSQPRVSLPRGLVSTPEEEDVRGGERWHSRSGAPKS